MGKQVSGRTAAGIAIAITLFISGTALGQDIDLPFDWFYGRWVDGHQPEMDFVWHETKKPARVGSYSFTSGSYMFGFDDIRGELVSYDGDGHLEFPTLFLRVRPRSNWQLGIDAVSYDAWDYSLTEPRGTHSRWSTSFRAHLSSHWMNRDTVLVDERHSAYSYLVYPVARKGTMQIANLFYFSQESSLSGSRYSDSAVYFYGDRTGSGSSVELGGDWRWSCSEGLQIGVFLNARSRNGLSHQNNSSWSDLPSGLSQESEHRSNSLLLTYSLRGQVVSLAPVYGVFTIGQDLSESSRHRWTIRSDPTHGQQMIERTEQHLFGEVSTSYSIDVHYVGRGEFDSRVVLDDYQHYITRTSAQRRAASRRSLQRFYDKIVFHRQLWVHSRFEYDRHNAYPEDNSRILTYQLAARYGLSGKVQLALNWKYEHYKFPGYRYRGWGYRYAVHSTSELGIKFRSFEYQAGAGPGWDRDTPEDVAFGPLLQAGMWQADIEFEPPTLVRHSVDVIAFGTLSNLENQHRASLAISAEVGLGSGLELRVYDTEFYYSADTYRRNFGATVTTRLRGFQLALEYSQTGHREIGFAAPETRFHVWGDWDHTDPVFSLNIRALL